MIRLKYAIAAIVLMGSVFDVKDVICYAVGCVFLGVYEIVRKKN